MQQLESPVIWYTVWTEHKFCFTVSSGCYKPCPANVSKNETICFFVQDVDRKSILNICCGFFFLNFYFYFLNKLALLLGCYHWDTMISSPCYFKVFNIKCGLDKPLCLRILVYFTGIKVYPSGLADVARINPLFYWTYLDQLGMVRYGFQVFPLGHSTWFFC